MNHLGMSVAPTSLTKALDSVGEDFDGEFKVWTKKLSCHLQGCQNKPATGSFHRLFRILRRLLRIAEIKLFS